MRLFQSTTYCVTFCFIKKSILDDDITFRRSYLSNYCANCFIYIEIYVEKVINLPFAAICAKQKNRKEEENNGENEEIETAIVERVQTMTNYVYFEVFILFVVIHLSKMLENGERISTDLV